MQRYTITYDPIHVTEVLNKVITPNHGANLCFIGTTREYTQGNRTIALHYEAYIPMAIEMMKQIGKELSEKWPNSACAITHRLGKVEIGEISVVIAVSTPHRPVCYEASSYAIERLKAIVPIWKKEIHEEGSVWIG